MPSVLADYLERLQALHADIECTIEDEMARRARARGFKWADLSLTSEDNPYTPTLAKRAGARLYKRYRVYRLWM